MSLTTEQWEIYDFVKCATTMGLTLTVKDFCNRFPEKFKLIERDGNYSNCPDLYKEIDNINSSYEIEKIIIKNHNRFKLATKEEAQKAHQRLKDKAIRLLVKASIMSSKIKADGQGKTVSCQDRAIDEESRAREFVESFVGD